jgi:Ser/Thr protein kinase RdoA (MazF antagonist)
MKLMFFVTLIKIAQPSALHFDIKSYNILLDNNFCSKFFDFDFTKICSREECRINIGCIGD